jgi:hypothetical protein
MSFELRTRKNLGALAREIDARPLVNRVYAKGADQGGRFMSMANARWPVIAIDTSEARPRIQLGENPIAFDDQLNPHLMQPAGSTAAYLIKDTFKATQEIELDHEWSDAIVSVGDYVHIRRKDPCDPNKWTELVYLDAPQSQAKYGGVWEGPVERPDIPPIDNLCPNPIFDDWGGTPFRPLNWTFTGGSLASIAQETAFERRRFGPYSVHIASELGVLGFTSLLGGIATLYGDWIPVTPTAENPFYSLRASVLLSRGGPVYMDMQCDLVGDGSEYVFVPSLTGTRCFTSVLNVWVEELGIDGGLLNMWERGVKRIRPRLYQHGGTEFWIDAVMLTNTATPPDEFYGKIASNELWHAANDELRRKSEPQHRYDADVHDLHRLEPGAFVYDQLVQGRAGRIVDLQLGIESPTRLVQLQQKLTRREVRTTATFSNAHEDLERLGYARRPRPRTFLPAPISEADPIDPTERGLLSTVRAEIQANPDGDGKDYILITYDQNQQVQGDGTGRYVVDIVSDLDGAVAVDRDPKLEFDGTDSIPRVGSFRWEINLGGASDPFVVNTVIVTFKDTQAGTSRPHKTSIMYHRVL